MGKKCYLTSCIYLEAHIQPLTYKISHLAWGGGVFHLIFLFFLNLHIVFSFYSEHGKLEENKREKERERETGLVESKEDEDIQKWKMK